MARTPLTFMAWLRWDLIHRALRDVAPGATLVEFGAGLGALGARLAEVYDYTAVEPDPTSAAVARARVGPVGGRVVVGTDQDLDTPEPVDAVCAFEVLEHFEDDEAVLRAWAGRLRPGGRIVLSVPAGPHRMGPHDELVGHYRRYDREELHRKLTGAGLVDVRVGCYGWPLGYALEWARNRAARRRLRSPEVVHEAMAARTASSGRTLQPPAVLGWVTWLVTRPFRAIQARTVDSDRGIGYIVDATRP